MFAAWADSPGWRLVALPDRWELVYIAHCPKEMSEQEYFDGVDRLHNVIKTQLYSMQYIPTAIVRYNQNDLERQCGKGNLPPDNKLFAGISISFNSDTWAMVQNRIAVPNEFQDLSIPANLMTCLRYLNDKKYKKQQFSSVWDDDKEDKNKALSPTYWYRLEEASKNPVRGGNMGRYGTWYDEPREDGMQLREQISRMYSTARNAQDGDYYRIASVLDKMKAEVAQLRDKQSRKDPKVTEVEGRITALESQLQQVLEALNTEAEARVKQADQQAEEDEDNPFKTPWSDGKAQLNMILSGLTEPRVSVDRVVLPDDIKAQILKVASQQNALDIIYNEWGFGETIEKGRTAAMCFVGEAGTGKTMMAEAIANHLGYLFWRIQSGNLQGSLMGEFEKGAAFVFKKARKIEATHALWEERRKQMLLARFTIEDKEPESLTIQEYFERGGKLATASTLDEYLDSLGLGPEPPKGVVILFDEADSLVAARDVQIAGGGMLAMNPAMSGEVNFILGELEEFGGVCIFATNRSVVMEKALRSRLSLTVEFPFPDKGARERIWRGLIPAKAPLADNVDFGILARYEIAGRVIKNAVINAARLATFTGSPHISQEHFLLSVKEQIESEKAYNQEKAVPQVNVTIVGGDNDMMRKIYTSHDKFMWN